MNRGPTLGSYSISPVVAKGVVVPRFIEGNSLPGLLLAMHLTDAVCTWRDTHADVSL